MKYIVCNTEQTLYNRVYDELEKHIEDGAVFSFTEKIIGTQFSKRIIDEKNNGKYAYKHIIFIGQKEFAGIDKEEAFGFFRASRKYLYNPLGVAYQNIYYPEYNHTADKEKFEAILEDNPIDVTILSIDAQGNIINNLDITEDNGTLHTYPVSARERNSLRKHLSIELEHNEIISVGYEHIMKSRHIFLIATGSDKKKYIETLLSDSEDKSFLSILKNHSGLTVFVDKEAGYKSEEEVNKIIKEKNRKKEQERLRKLEEELLAEKGK